MWNTVYNRNRVRIPYQTSRRFLCSLLLRLRTKYRTATYKAKYLLGPPRGRLGPDRDRNRSEVLFSKFRGQLIVLKKRKKL